MRRYRLERRLRFNLKSGIESRIKAVPALDGVPEAVLHDLAMTLAIHFTAPGERVLKRARRVRTVYFVSAGQFDRHVAEHDIRFAPGSVLGAEDLLGTGRMGVSVRSLGFGHLLAISAREFRRLADEHPVVRTNIERLRRARTGEPEQLLLGAPGRQPATAIAAMEDAAPDPGV